MDESRNSPAAASVGSKRKLSTSGSSSDYARDGDHSKVSDSDSPVRQAPSKKARSSRHADGSRRRGGAGHADHVGGEYRERRRSVSLEADMDQRFALLSQQLVSHINNILTTNLHMQAVPTLSCLNSASNCTDLPTQNSNIPIVNNGEFLNPPSCSVVENISDLSVTVKEPSITTALPDRVVKLTALQRFDSPNWNAVRYTETQKKYVASPGFIELKLNEELKRFDDPQGSSSWSKMERSFAALSNAVMAQNEIINAALQNLIDWSAKSNNQLSPNTIYSKLKELFGDNSDYKSASHDILQITCGKRAEVIESRRRNILKNILFKLNTFAMIWEKYHLHAITCLILRHWLIICKRLEQPRTANKTRRNERKESNRINNDEASSEASLLIFITTREPIKPATPTIIGGWIKKLLSEAGIKSSPGSLRSAVSSLNWLENYPINEILEKANWRHENTFRKFYQKNVQPHSDLQISQKSLSQYFSTS
ncbi:hypothetical protein ACJJTC_015994 [Scirpophaga incertulas]